MGRPKRVIKTYKNYDKYIRKNNIITSLQLIFILIFIVSAIHVVNWKIQNRHTIEEKNKLIESVSYSDRQTISSINFDELVNQNPDTVGWIEVNGTDINYPVVQAKDNEFYLYHSFDKSKSNAGWIYLDCRNGKDFDNRNTIIFGHNRKDGSLFGTLKNILKESWYEDENNLIIKIWTKNKMIEYRVFSIYETPNEDFYISTTFDDYLNFLKTIKSRSLKYFDVELNDDSKILTLSTCSNSSDKRIVLHAVMKE